MSNITLNQEYLPAEILENVDISILDSIESKKLGLS